MTDTKRVIALGFFDGVHLGHGALLSLCVRRAKELHAVASAFTFDAHPASVITGSMTPLLTTPADRAGLMRREYGIRDVIVAHYDRAMMTMPWREFVTDYLVRDNGAIHLVVGHDFHFGYKGEGNPQRLQALCAELGVGCDVVSKVELDGITVSSTYIRSLIAQGEMARAVRFLGHPHVLTGSVNHGKKLGSTLGFPTVNLRFPTGLLIPARGVYATKVWLLPGGDDRAPASGEAECFAAVTNVGVRPTVDQSDAVTVEGYILDFHGDLYGQGLRMEFYDFLRPERKFASLSDLHDAVMENAQQTRDFFAASTR